MTIIIFGSMGNIGRRLMPAYPGAIGIDRVAGADIVADIGSIDYEAPEIVAAFKKADGVIHVATSANTDDPDAVHWAAVTATARLLAACDKHDIKRVVIPSSDWAEPKTRWAMHEQNAYGWSKGVFEAMARMYNVRGDRHCVALRIGWVAKDYAQVEAAPEWLQANYWDDRRLLGQMQAALGT